MPARNPRSANQSPAGTQSLRLKRDGQNGLIAARCFTSFGREEILANQAHIAGRFQVVLLRRIRRRLMDRKVLLIGWDAADWEHINPLLEEGLMPTLDAFINRGVM